MEDFIHFLQGTMEEPEVISWFHFIALIPIIALAILIPIFFRKIEEKIYKRILLTSSRAPKIKEAIYQLR